MAKAGILGTVQTTPTNTADVEVYKVPTTGVSFAVVDIHVGRATLCWLKTADGRSCIIHAEIITPPHDMLSIQAISSLGRIVRKVVLGPGESVVAKTDTLTQETGTCVVYGIEHV